jgi:hypothetical protein
MNSQATHFTAEPAGVSAIACRFALSAIVLAIGVAGASLELGNKALLEWFCREDGPVENLTALFYLLAAGMFIYANRGDGFRNIWLWGYAVLFFLVAGEEISWGQRLFCIDTPEVLVRVNVQGEANLHNIEGVHGTVRAVGLVIILAVCYAIPLSSRFFRPLRDLLGRLRHPVFPLWAAGITTLAILFMVIPRLGVGQALFGIDQPGRFDELGEFALAIAFLVFGVNVCSQSVRNEAVNEGESR